MLRKQIVHIIGLGVMGSSLAAKLQNAGLKVYGVDSNQERLGFCLNEGIIEGDCPSHEPDIVFVATSPGSVKQIVKQVSNSWSSSIITDLTGVKSPIVASIKCPQFVGGHPMCGSEKSGPEHANPSMFDGATWVLTPTDDTDPRAFSNLSRFLREVLNCYVQTLKPEEHDAYVAAISHLPHVLANALINLVADKSSSIIWNMAGGGFRDMTRIAASPVGAWPELLVLNKESLLDEIEALTRWLDNFKVALNKNDIATLEEKLLVGKRLRESLKRSVLTPEILSTISIRIPNRPGALVEMLDVLRLEAINVYDLEIIDLPDNIYGVAILKISPENYERAEMALVKNSFNLLED